MTDVAKNMNEVDLTSDLIGGSDEVKIEDTAKAEQTTKNEAKVVAKAIESEKKNMINNEFLNHLDEKSRKSVLAAAASLAERLRKDPSLFVTLGGDLTRQIKSTAERMVREQNTDLPEADKILSAILTDMKGYSRTYSSGKGQEGFFGPLLKFIRRKKNDLAAMKIDAMKLMDKFEAAEQELTAQHHSLQENISNGAALKGSVKDMIAKNVKILAIIESVVDYLRVKGKEISAVYEAAKKANKISGIMFEGEAYTMVEIEDLVKSYGTALSSAESKWTDWRSQLFLFRNNLIAIDSIVDVSVKMQDTCLKVRNDIIPAALNQLVVQQQAERAARAADVTESMADGMNVLMREAAKSTAENIAATANATKRAVLTQETVAAFAEALPQQFQSLLEAERNSRAKNREIVEAIVAAEKRVNEADTEHKLSLINDANEQLAKSGVGSAEVDSLIGSL